MAMLLEGCGLIRDRSKGYRELCYYIPTTSKQFMRACKEAHELITKLLPYERRIAITGKELRQTVLLYVSVDDESKRKLIAKLAMEDCFEKPGSHTLSELFELWKKGKIAEDLNTEKQIKAIEQCQRTMFDFFNVLPLSLNLH